MAEQLPVQKPKDFAPSAKKILQKAAELIQQTGGVCGQSAQLQLLIFQRAGSFGHRYHCNKLFLPGAYSEATSKAE